jgi:hypothetical protein
MFYRYRVHELDGSDAGEAHSGSWSRRAKRSGLATPQAARRRRRPGRGCGRFAVRRATACEPVPLKKRAISSQVKGLAVERLAADHRSKDLGPVLLDRGDQPVDHLVPLRRQHERRDHVLGRLQRLDFLSERRAHTWRLPPPLTIQTGAHQRSRFAGCLRGGRRADLPTKEVRLQRSRDHLDRDRRPGFARLLWLSRPRLVPPAPIRNEGISHARLARDRRTDQGSSW